MALRYLAATVGLLLFWAPGCNRGEDGGKLSPAEREKLKTELKAEIAAELEPKLKRELLRVMLDRKTVLADAGKRDRSAVDVPEADPAAPVRLPRERPAEEAAVDAPRAAAAPVEVPPIEEPTPEPADEPATEPTEAPALPVAEEPAAEPGEPGIEPSDVEIVQLVIGDGLDREKRVPLNPGRTFSADSGKLYAYVIAKNPGEETKLTIEWLLGGPTGKVMSRIALRVGHSTRGWRTWSTLRISSKSVGSWHVRVLDAAGAVVGKTSFRVTN